MDSLVRKIVREELNKMEPSSSKLSKHAQSTLATPVENVKERSQRVVSGLNSLIGRFHNKASTSTTTKKKTLTKKAKAARPINVQVRFQRIALDDKVEIIPSRLSGGNRFFLL